MSQRRVQFLNAAPIPTRRTSFPYAHAIYRYLRLTQTSRGMIVNDPITVIRVLLSRPDCGAGYPVLHDDGALSLHDAQEWLKLPNCAEWLADRDGILRQEEGMLAPFIRGLCRLCRNLSGHLGAVWLRRFYHRGVAMSQYRLLDLSLTRT